MIASMAARATLALVAIVSIVFLVRRRVRGSAAAAAVAVLARVPLGPGVGVALLDAHGRRFLVGWGKDGVRLVRDLGAGEGRS